MSTSRVVHVEDLKRASGRRRERGPLWVTESYEASRAAAPSEGRHVMAQFDDESVIVYQAFNPEIASYAVEFGMFNGAPGYTSRMTWVKPGFIWMMYRSGWARKSNQERILAIHLNRCFFNELLRNATTKGGDLRIQWDPDHSPRPPYTKLTRRAIQLGLRGSWQHRLASGSEIECIQDVTDFVRAQWDVVFDDGDGHDRSTWQRLLQVAYEREYPVPDKVRAHLRMCETAPVASKTAGSPERSGDEGASTRDDEAVSTEGAAGGAGGTA